MIAEMMEDSYRDLRKGIQYEVEKVFSDKIHFKLKGSKRKYMMNCFSIKHNGIVITKTQAYRVYCFEEAKKKI